MITMTVPDFAGLPPLLGGGLQAVLVASVSVTNCKAVNILECAPVPTFQAVFGTLKLRPLVPGVEVSWVEGDSARTVDGYTGLWA